MSEDAMKVVDQSREWHHEPCGDCGRSHLRGEHVVMRVPTPDGGVRDAWWGCVDCWLWRTSPARWEPHDTEGDA